jgi:cytochrome c biogenesis protein CcmG, thiol:disulfide interchange protein DsbE
MLRRIAPILLLPVLLTVFAACKRGAGKNNHTELVGKPFPDFRFPASGGTDTVTLAQLKGRPSMVVFWATWCGPCREEVEHLRQMLAEYQGIGLRVVGLSIDESAAPVPLMVQQLSIPYPVGTGALPFFDSLGLEYIPQSYLLDPQGVVVEAFGYVNAAQYKRGIEKYLASK